MATPLVIRTVAVAKAPGFAWGRFPVLEELQPGLNVVWGPNGAGKSTLARALRGLLWPGPAGAQAQASVLVGGEAWHLERVGESLRQTRLADNHQSQGQWGGAEDAERHWFSLHELLQAQGRDGAFQAYIQNLMRDGVDLDAACALAGGLDRPLAANAGEHQALRRAVESRRRIQTAQEGQKALADQLKESAAEVVLARQAGQSLGELRQTLAYLEAQARLQDARDKLKSFPEAVARLSAEDPQRLAELQRKEAALLAEIKDGEAALLNKRKQLAALQVPEGLLAESSLKARIQALGQELQGLEPAWRQAQGALAKAEGIERAWREQLGWLCPEPPQAPLLRDLVQRLRTLAATCEPLRCALDLAQRRVQGLGLREPAGPLDTVEHWAEVQACLLGWLRRSIWASLPAEGAGALAGAPWPLVRARWAVAGATLLVLLGAALAILVKPLLALVALLAPLLVAAALRPAKAEAALEGERARAAARIDQEEARRLLAAFPELLPRTWTPEALLELQKETAARFGQAQQRRQRNAEREQAGDSLKLAEAAYGHWLSAWPEAAAALDVRWQEPALEGAQFFHFALHLSEWMLRLEAVAEARAQEASRARALAEGLGALQELLRTRGGLAEPAATPVQLLAQAQDLLERRDQALQLALQEAELRQQLARKAGADLVQSVADLDAFWQARGFQAPDAGRLLEWAALVKERQGAVLASELAEAALQALASPAVLARAQGRDLAGLDHEQRGLEATAALLEERSTRHGTLREQHETLLGGEVLANALRSEAEARRALERAQQDNTLGRVITLLVRELKEKSRLEAQPAVLGRASAWLRRFTRDRLALGIHPETGFFAQDTVLNQTFGLDELSSGTRVQLLFAVRMAFIEELEGQSVAMPIFLDEVLANSDDDRAQAMIEALLEIARVRQVFYFTAQADEVAKLRALAGPARAGESGGCHEVPLGQLASARALAQAPLAFVDLRPFELPEPLEDYDAYGLACGVAGAEPFAPIESLHLWHLFSRTQDLLAVLRFRSHHIGQLQAASSPEAAALAPRIELLGRAQALAQQGRGRPLQAQDLLDAELPGVNRKAGYWTAVRDLALVAAGDAFLFERSLKAVAGLREDPRAVIRAWLLERQYLSEESPLETQEILLALHQEFPWLTVPSEERRVVERYLRSLNPANTVHPPAPSGR